jgi:hypothetical protein
VSQAQVFFGKGLISRHHESSGKQAETEQKVAGIMMGP